MNFSERMGYKKPPEVLQIDRMSDDLRNSVWNLFLQILEKSPDPRIQIHYMRSLYIISKGIYANCIKEPIDVIREHDKRNMLHNLKLRCFEINWFEVYDWVEEFVRIVTEIGIPLKLLDESFNQIYARERSGFRLNSGIHIPFTNEIELNEIQEALLVSSNDKYSVVNSHLTKAIKLLSLRPDGDFHNSIKESITAVEAVCKVISGVSSGGIKDAIRELDLPRAMEEGFKKLYGWTSGKGGIRHPMMEAEEITLAEAKYMLVTCSAFVNFVIQKTI